MVMVCSNKYHWASKCKIITNGHTGKVLNYVKMNRKNNDLVLSAYVALDLFDKLYGFKKIQN